MAATVYDPVMLINDARRFAGLQLDNADAASSSARGALAAISDGGVYQAIPVEIEPPFVVDPGVPPEYHGSRFSPQKFGKSLGGLREIGNPTVQPTYGTAPKVEVFNKPDKPPGDTADATLLQNVPVLLPISVPGAPDLLSEIHGITKPDIISITIPDAPIYVAPEFTGTRPVFDAEMPTDLDATMRTQYQTISPVMRDAVTSQIDAFIDHEFPSFRSGLAKIEDRLNTYLNGGSALSAAIENAIHSRTLDKTNREGRRAADTAWKDAAKAGYTMPTAYLLAKKQDIDQMRRDNNARAAIDIAVKQAELEQHNLQFAVTQSASLRQVAISSALSYYSGLIQINGQALEYARSIVDAIVKAFDIAARYAEVQTRIYEAEANIYSAKLRGALAVFEAYNAKIRGLEAQSNVNLAQVQVYKARLDAVMAEANVYRAEVDGALAKATIERAKVDIYQARVQAYGAQVNASTAAWQGYVAACQGESAKVSASAEAVRAWTAKVNAYSAEVSAKGNEIQAIATSNEGKARAFSAEASAFSAQVQAESASVQAEIASYDETLKAYQAKASVIARRSETQIRAYEVALRQLENQAQMQFQYLQEANAMRVAKATGMARISQSLAAVHGASAQAALSGMNSLASVSTTSSA